jgi:hypothetical protein
MNRLNAERGPEPTCTGQSRSRTALAIAYCSSAGSDSIGIGAGIAAVLLTVDAHQRPEARQHFLQRSRCRQDAADASNSIDTAIRSATLGWGHGVRSESSGSGSFGSFAGFGKGVGDRVAE